MRLPVDHNIKILRRALVRTEARSLARLQKIPSYRRPWQIVSYRQGCLVQMHGKPALGDGHAPNFDFDWSRGPPYVDALVDICWVPVYWVVFFEPGD